MTSNVNYLKSVITIFISYKIIIQLVILAYEHLPLQLLHFEHFATEDIQFNDIYYSTSNKNNLEDFDVVLINSGSIVNNDSFRINLARLIDKVADFKPKKIGIDFVFKSKKKGDEFLQNSITKNKVVLIKDQQTLDKNVFKSEFIGIGNFPVKKDETIRTYYNYTTLYNKNYPSFAAVLCDINRKDSISYLKYSTDQKGFYDYLSEDSNKSERNIPAIEALSILNGLPNAQIEECIKNKIVIVGHLGNGYMNNQFDIEDKFKVPNNSSLIDRLPTMPGAAVHANAVQMLINNDEVIIIHGWQYELITSLILFLFLMLFYAIHHRYYLGKLINLLIILGSTIPFILISCIYLMNSNIFYKVGSLFMQIAFLEEFIDIADGFKKLFKKYR